MQTCHMSRPQLARKVQSSTKCALRPPVGCWARKRLLPESLAFGSALVPTLPLRCQMAKHLEQLTKPHSSLRKSCACLGNISALMFILATTQCISHFPQVLKVNSKLLCTVTAYPL